MVLFVKLWQLDIHWSAFYFWEQSIFINLTCCLCPVLGISRFHRWKNWDRCQMIVTEFRLKTLVEHDFLVQDLFLFVLSLWQEMGCSTWKMTTATFPESSLCARCWAKHFHGFFLMRSWELCVRLSDGKGRLIEVECLLRPQSSWLSKSWRQDKTHTVWLQACDTFHSPKKEKLCFIDLFHY